jgi:hypothetical protein
MAVCEYCKATVLKDADSVKDLGKMSDVLEDYSPIQIGTSGSFGGRNFSVIGRIQLRYPAGLWNEWYLLFENGDSAWLGDASGQYTLSTERTPNPNTLLPAFADLAPANPLTIGPKNYTVADVRIADCIGGQGELPFRVGQGWQARVADLRSGNSFLTLDYSESIAPKMYIGQAVTLDQLKCQLLRDDDEVQTSAGKFRGKIDRLACPSCGSHVAYAPGITTHLVCPSCHAQVDTTAKTAQVLAAGNRMAAVRTTLELGAKATINGRQYQLIGLMKRRDDEDDWTEYLLHNPRAGFLWLIETDDGWARAVAQDDWPRWSNQGDSAILANRTFRKLYAYTSRITFAAGAFSWRVGVGDSTRVVEFEDGKNKLAVEMTSDEMSWSMSAPVPPDQIRAWFGKDVKADKRLKSDLQGMTGKFIVGILAANAIPLLFAFWSTWTYVALGIAAVYFPAKYLDELGEDPE